MAGYAENITRAENGTWHGSYGAIPTPGHSKSDRGTTIRDSDDRADVIVYTFNSSDQDWRDLKADWRRRGLLPERPRANDNATGAWRETGVYEYRARDGTVCYRTVRKEKTGERKRFVAQRPDGRGAWINGLGDVPRVLYRLPEIAAADPAATVYLVEGERKADKLGRWGLVGTAVAFGAKGWRDEYAEALAGRTVAILPDVDEPGRAFADRARKGIVAAGGRAVIIDLPDLRPGGDIMDWTGDRAELERLVTETIVADRKGTGTPAKGLAASQGVTAASLMNMSFAPINYVIPGYLAEGLSILAGPPKLGKSWMALGWALAVASQRPAFGSIPVDHGDALYLALEDNPRRLKKRLLHMQQGAPDRLTFMTEWPSMDQGCVDQLEAWVSSVERPRLIVVDVLTKVRGGARNGETAYEADYRALTGLQGIAGRNGIAVVAVHHTRKMEADDPFDGVSGTRGLTGAADTVLVIKRDIGTGGSGRVTLYGRGRDIEEIETALEFERDNGTWRIIGAAHETARTDERQAILDCLAKAANPLTSREVSDLIGKNYGAVRKTLTRMAAGGEIEKTGRGLYTCPNSRIVPNDASTPSSWDNGTLGTGYIDQRDIGDPNTWGIPP